MESHIFGAIIYTSSTVDSRYSGYRYSRFSDIVDILLPTNFLFHNIVWYSGFLVVDITRYSRQRDFCIIFPICSIPDLNDVKSEEKNVGATKSAHC